MSLVYLDASALVKLVVVEPESNALIAFLHGWPDRVSSAGLALIDADRGILGMAAAFDPPGLRTLDVIHLATALAVREDLVGLVTYDRRLATAAARVDVEVLAPP